MKKLVAGLKFYFVVIFILMSGSVFALTEEECEELITIDPAAYNEFCTEDPESPLDSGVYYLIVLGAGLAIKTVHANSKGLSVERN